MNSEKRQSFYGSQGRPKVQKQQEEIEEIPSITKEKLSNMLIPSIPSKKSSKIEKQDREMILQKNQQKDNKQQKKEQSQIREKETHVDRQSIYKNEKSYTINYTQLKPGEIQLSKVSPSFSQFGSAWKSETNMTVVMIQKLSQITSKYFKLLPEVKKRNQQLQILISYNTQLIEILGKFQDKEKKLIMKLKTMEELSSKCMKELCSLKGKPFRGPTLKEQTSIFQKFSLINLKYEIRQQQVMKEDLDYKLKLEGFFRKFLLKQKFDPQLLQQINHKLAKYQNQNKNQQYEDNITHLTLLLEKAHTYNDQVNKASPQNLFDLYYLRESIVDGLKKMISEDQVELLKVDKEAQGDFVKNVTALHANLLKMQESQILHYLKNQKDIQKKHNRLKIKQQQKFIRLCEKTESQCTYLKNEIIQQKKKIKELKQQLSRSQAELDFKSMKMRVSNKPVAADQSMDGDGRMSRRLLKDNIKTLQKQINQLKKYKQDSQLTKQQRKNVRISTVQKLREHQIIVKINVEDQVNIIHAMSDKMVEAKKQFTQGHKQDSLVSPHLQGLYGFGTVGHNFLKPIPQIQRQQVQKADEKHKQQIGALQNRIKQLELKIKQLQKDLNDKQLLIKNHVEQCQKSQNQIKEKITAINQLVSQYQTLKRQIDNLTLQKNIMSKRQYLAQILGNNIIEITQRYQGTKVNSTNYNEVTKKLLNDLLYQTKMYDNDRKRQTIEEQILLGLDDYTSSKKPDPSDHSQSFHSYRSKRQQNIRFSEKSHTQFKKKIQGKQIASGDKLSNISGRPNIKKRQSQTPQKYKQQKNLIKPIISNQNVNFRSANQQQYTLKSPQKKQLKMKSNTQVGLLLNQSPQKPSQSKPQQIQKQEKSKQKILDLINSIRRQISPEQLPDEEKKQQSITRKVPSIKLIGVPSLKNSHNFVDLKQSQQNILSSVERQIILGDQSEHLGNQSEHKRQSNSNINLSPKKSVVQPHKKSELQSSEKFKNDKSKLKDKQRANTPRQSKQSLQSLQFQQQANIRIFGPQQDLLNQKQYQEEKKQKFRNSKNVSADQGEIQNQQMSFTLSNDGSNSKFVRRSHNFDEMNQPLLHSQASDKKFLEDQKLGLDNDFVQRVINRIDKSKSDPDTLDFYQLYQRYKQAVKCLDRSEKLNKIHEHKYQQFVKKLFTHRQINEKQYSFEEQIFHLTRLVHEQRQRLEQQQWQFDQGMGKQIVQSKQSIDAHLRMLREQQGFKIQKVIY